ncbi:flagellar motor protein [Granulicella tundricola]|uniref:MotA/TolQ/ExbB proton channel n=1 Tax=Granulicella tundricola (strain ATCC BAA-1859 / DSM 23138 / MP5ACTX9) TaxID=1198114 RepID=E8X609_GRATM|nr:flagellar motor protein [Granulicella tundricola]ADW70893.1 MotA/TolQ/ExbB proton channel [Granulicella tundricola MP5ACTX9]
MGKRQIDKSTVVGVMLAGAGVVAGLLLDGGTVRQILQPTAALIVVGGTLGAVMIQFPMQTIRSTIKELRHALLDAKPLNRELVEELVSWCLQARRMGMLALDAYLPQIADPFFRKGMMLAVDGVGVRELRDTLEVDLDVWHEREAGVAKVLEAAGGFAPTLGIIGAVLGLIQVMQRMDNVGEIGKGIAVAFVSTLYGIGLANLVFLPLAGKLKIRMRERQLVREMTLEAVVSIMEGVSARALRQRLEAYLTEGPSEAQGRAEPEMTT